MVVALGLSGLGDMPKNNRNAESRPEKGLWRVVNAVMRAKQRKDGAKAGASGVLMALLMVCSANGQTQNWANTASAAGSTPSSMVREIKDPHSGIHWLLMRNLAHPGGPGQLVPVTETEIADAKSKSEGAMGKEEKVPVSADEKTSSSPSIPTRVIPIVHPGDRLVVEEHTRVADVRLEAIAMAPAAVGSIFTARLKIGGKVVHVKALEPGRAVLQEAAEAQHEK
jgi:hypothetical protein